MLDRGPKGLKPEKLGEAIYTALTTPKPKVRYVVTPDRVQEIVSAILPKRTMDKLIAGRLGLTRN